MSAFDEAVRRLFGVDDDWTVTSEINGGTTQWSTYTAEDWATVEITVAPRSGSGERSQSREWTDLGALWHDLTDPEATP